MDGVIVNSHPAHRSAWKQFLHSVGKTVPEDDLDFILDGRKRNEILTYFFGPLCEQQLREYGDRKDAFFQAISPQDEAMPGVDELIIRLGAFKRHLSLPQRMRSCEPLSARIKDDELVVVLGRNNAQSEAKKKDWRPA